MLKRAYRLRKDRDFQKIYRKGQRRTSPNFTLYYLPTKFAVTQVGFVVSKKVSKSAVVRNRLRRRATAIVEELYAHIQPSKQVIILIRQDFSAMIPQELKKELHNLLKIVT